MRIFIFKLFSGHKFGRKRIVQKALEAMIRLLNPVRVNDHKMFIDPKDDAMALFTKGSYEPLITECFKKHIKKGDTVLDLGAYIGYHTLIMAKLVGPKGKVYAFEPSKTNFHYLKKNIAENRYENVIACCKAVSGKSGAGRYYVGDRSSLGTIYGGGRWEEIETIRLDDCFKDKVDFIKMDIEGAEGLALEGMKETIKNSPNLKMVIEYQPEMLEKAGTDPREFLDTLKSFGFKPTQLDNENLFFEKR